jgi:hypothetical protein
MARMSKYHLHLKNEDENVAMIEVEASNNTHAAAIATAVFQACTDACDGFEIRRDAYWIAGMSKRGLRRELILEELAAQVQEQVVQVEEALLESRTKVAQSRQLLDRTAKSKLKAVKHMKPPHAALSALPGPEAARLGRNGD